MATKEENAAKYAELEAKLGADNIRRVDTFAGMLVFKAPSPGDWFRAESMGILDPKGGGWGKSVETLARCCVVHPSAEALDALISRYPAITLKAGNALAWLAGVRSEEEGKE